MSARHVVLTALAVLLPLAGGGCGVPAGEAPATIAPADVPYGLAAPSSPAPAPSPSAPVDDQPVVYLVGPGNALVPRGREDAQDTTAHRLEDLLAGLAAGPTAAERREGLSTALPPGVQLSVAETDDGTVTVDIGGAAEAPSGRESRTAVAQIVLTATSLPEVEGVLLTRAGTPVEAPLPSGELTSAPLSAADYAGFLTTLPD